MNVVFQRDRDAVQRAAHTSLRAFRVTRVGLGERSGIDGDRGVDAAVVQRDARQVLGDDVARSHAVLLHRALHVGDRGLDHREAG
jgi:hypothetical protein